MTFCRRKSVALRRGYLRSARKAPGTLPGKPAHLTPRGCCTGNGSEAPLQAPLMAEDRTRENRLQKHGLQRNPHRTTTAANKLPGEQGSGGVCSPRCSEGRVTLSYVQGLGCSAQEQGMWTAPEQPRKLATPGRTQHHGEREARTTDATSTLQQCSQPSSEATCLDEGRLGTEQNTDACKAPRSSLIGKEFDQCPERIAQKTVPIPPVVGCKHLEAVERQATSLVTFPLKTGFAFLTIHGL